MLVYLQKLITNAEARITIIDAAGVIKQNAEMKETIRAIEQTAPQHIAMYTENIIEKSFLEQQDLMIINMESWKRLIETQSIWLTNTPSVLILRK